MTPQDSTVCHDFSVILFNYSLTLEYLKERCKFKNQLFCVQTKFCKYESKLKDETVKTFN